jgi:hypothetical protein
MPDNVLRWFGNSLAVEECRDDVYLRLDECATTGVKLRQGHFEIKSLTVAPQTILLGRDIAGLYDSWIKWSVTADAVQPFGLAMCRDAPTVVVGKRRWLRRLSMDQACPAEISAKSHLNEGCNVELATITVGEQVWWSFCFEAFAPEREKTADHMLRGAGHFLQTNQPPCGFMRADALSYPAWIVGLP